MSAPFLRQFLFLVPRTYCIHSCVLLRKRDPVFLLNAQIYNEQITDLLDPSQKNLQVKKWMAKYSSITQNPLLILLIWPIPLQIREDVRTACVYVESLTKQYVFTMKDVTQLLVKVCTSILTYSISIIFLWWHWT